MSNTKVSYSMITGAPVNVLDYGAVADYVYATNTGTDNTAAFQAAINDAQLNKKSLYIPGGNYRLANALSVTKTISIYGDGRVNSRLWLTNNAEDGIVISGGEDYMWFVGFNLVYRTKGTGNGIVIGYDTAQVHFEDMYVDSANYGIYCANRTFLVTLSNIVAARCNTGVWLSGEIGGGGSTIRAHDSYFLGNQIGFYVQFTTEVTVTDCATDFTDDISYLGLQFYACTTIYVQNLHAEGITAPVGFGGGNIVAAVRIDDCQSLIVDGLYYDLDGDSGPNVYAISSQTDTINPVIHANGITKGSYISASNKRISTVSSGAGVHTLLEAQGDWGSASGYDNSGVAAIRIKSSSAGLELFGLDTLASLTRSSGIQTGVIKSSADNNFVLSCVPDSGNVQLEHKDSGGTTHQVMWSSTDTSLRVNAAGDDNAYSLGTATRRWSVVYAATGTINTSDKNEKQDISVLDSSEYLVANRLKGLIRKFRFKNAVKEKGDDARIHVGVIAQDIKIAFEAEGLDANRYGVFCSDTWVDDAGVEQTRLGVRYEELYAFIISTL